MVMYGLYIAVVTVFSVMLSISVIGSVIRMSPRAAQAPDAMLVTSECVGQAEALWRELDSERRAFTQSQPARAVDEKFSQFRVEWLQKLRRLESRCSGESAGRKSLQMVFRRLDQVLDLYTTHAV